MNLAKDIFINHELFSNILDEDFSKKKFMARCLKELPLTELEEAIKFLEESKKKLSNISENLILKNMSVIINDGKRIETMKISDYSSLKAKLESTKQVVGQLDLNFTQKYLRVQKLYTMLQNIYKVKKLAINYKNFLQLTDELEKMLESKFDLIQASEKCQACLKILLKNEFEGLKFYDQKKKVLERSHQKILRLCENRLEKSLEGMNLMEVKNCFTAFGNLGILQERVQALTNQSLKQIYSTIKRFFSQKPKNFSTYQNSYFHPLNKPPAKEEASGGGRGIPSPLNLARFTNSAEKLSNQKSPQKKLNSRQMSYIDSTIKNLGDAKQDLHNILNTMLQNTLKIWMIEIGLDENQLFLNKSHLSKLFNLYHTKFRKILCQNFRNLIEYQNNYLINFFYVFGNASFLEAGLKDIFEKIKLFIGGYSSMDLSKNLAFYKFDDFKDLKKLGVSEALLKAGGSGYDEGLEDDLEVASVYQSVVKCVRFGFLGLFKGENQVFDFEALRDRIVEDCLEGSEWSISAVLANEINAIFSLFNYVLKNCKIDDFYPIQVISCVQNLLDTIFPGLHEHLTAQIYEEEGLSALELVRRKIKGTFKINELTMILSYQLATIQNSISNLKYELSQNLKEVQIKLLDEFCSQKEFFAKKFIEFNYDYLSEVSTETMAEFIDYFFDDNRIKLLFKIFMYRSKYSENELCLALAYWVGYLDAAEGDGKHAIDEDPYYRFDLGYLKAKILEYTEQKRGERGKFQKYIYGVVKTQILETPQPGPQ